MDDQEFLDEATSHYRLFISGEEAMPTVVCRGRHDKVVASYGIGKLKAIATSNKGFLLDSLGVVDIPWDSVENEATKFMVAFYEGSGVPMSETR